jgi:radical SAM superfamily enzyme YgiQ (UPF0313 family)
MRLYLINPTNQIASLVNRNRWSKYRIWKPLGLMVLAGLTPPEWDIKIIDENLGVPDYAKMPRPDLVGITAFTSQARRAYQVASVFRGMNVPVVMGGIHASMCTEEAIQHVDSVAKGEAESIWAQILHDSQNGGLKQVYEGEPLDLENVPSARQDLLPKGYVFGSIQTTRGCPLNCSFCSVSVFNGKNYRNRPIENVINEFKEIREKYVLVVDDNLIGTTKKHTERAKDLFRAMIRAKLKKRWICQATINIADDEELLNLAAQSGCVGVFIGFESPAREGLKEINKNFNLGRLENIRESIQKIKRHNLLVVGSFIIGLDGDKKGIGRSIAKAGIDYGIDLINVLFLTPLPGTRLWDDMKQQNRIAANNFPDDWDYYTLTYPVAQYQQLSWSDIITEMEICEKMFYSKMRIMWRVAKSLMLWRYPLFAIVSNLSYRKYTNLNSVKYREFNKTRSQVKNEGDKERIQKVIPELQIQTKKSEKKEDLVEVTAD